ncbi:30S ribosomal protein S15 [Candidatus Woesearchaeota archaeon]|nr:30S ribosomal protein S15 [Candidatus Woesearchaeota archaeon]
MARMHGGAKGKSGSTKPSGKTGYAWLSYKPREVEMLIVKMAKEGKPASLIGLTLRDAYGIPDARVLLKKKITEVLKAKKLVKELPEDMLALIKRSVALHKHMNENKQDMTAKRGLQLTESKIKRLIKYYKKNGRIAEDWKYDPSKAGMFLE